MQFPAGTAIYAGLLTLLLVALSLWVIVGRGSYKVNLGDGGKSEMQVRVRAHGNFIEYVPLILLLAALLEMSHTSRFIIHALLLPLLIARIVHPLGLSMPPLSPRQFALRGAPAVVTLLVLAVSAILLLLRGLDMPS